MALHASVDLLRDASHPAPDPLRVRLSHPVPLAPPVPLAVVVADARIRAERVAELPLELVGVPSQRRPSERPSERGESPILRTTLVGLTLSIPRPSSYVDESRFR